MGKNRRDPTCPKQKIQKLKKVYGWPQRQFFALALNIKITLDDPFLMLSGKAVAQTTTYTFTQICKGSNGTLCNNLKPNISTVWKHKITGNITVAAVGVDLGWWYKSIGYDYICQAAQPAEWCDIAKQGRFLDSNQ